MQKLHACSIYQTENEINTQEIVFRRGLYGFLIEISLLADNKILIYNELPQGKPREILLIKYCRQHLFTHCYISK